MLNCIVFCFVTSLLSLPAAGAAAGSHPRLQAARQDVPAATREGGERSAGGARRPEEEARRINALAVAQGKAGRLAEAIALFKRAAGYDPANAVIHYNLGIAYYRTNAYDEAIESFRRAIRLDPNYAPALNDLGRAYADSGRPEMAAEWLERAIRLDPKLADALYNLGMTYVRMRNRDASLRQFARLKGIDADSADRLYKAIFSDKVV